MISAALGVFISTIGMDPIMGIGRFTLGVPDLQKGIPIIAALIGLFGISEILFQISIKKEKAVLLNVTKDKVMLKDLLRHWFLGIRSSVIGALIGALPGAGGPVASLLAYDQAKKSTKNPEVPFGEGAVEGIVASESANNGCIGGALIPMLTLAVPGDAVTAVILSAFYIHGLRPGPLLFQESPQMFGVILAGGFIGCFMILLLGLTIGPLLSKIAIVQQKHLFPIVVILCVIGAYAASTSSFDILLMLVFGFIGFLMRKRGFPVAPMVLGLVLGSIMDSNFRRAVSLASSSSTPFAELFLNPISMILTLAVLLSVASNFISFKKVFRKVFRNRKEA